MTVYFGPVSSLTGTQPAEEQQYLPPVEPGYEIPVPAQTSHNFTPFVDFGTPGGTGIEPPKPVIPPTPPTPVTPTIDFFNDNVGLRQGSFQSGDHTDDARPTLFGRGTPGATLQLNYYTDEAWAFHEVVVDSDGIWTFTPPRDLLVDEWTFAIREKGESAWANEFVINYTGQDEKGATNEVVSDSSSSAGALPEAALLLAESDRDLLVDSAEISPATLDVSGLDDAVIVSPAGITAVIEPTPFFITDEQHFIN